MGRTIARSTVVAVVLGLLVVGGAGAPRASSPPDPCPDPVFHLHRSSGGDLLLEQTAPTATTPNFTDSPALTRAAGYQPIGTWETYVTEPLCQLVDLSDLIVFLGLRNSDDQGTRFDLLAEALVDNSVVATGELTCITGVTRNPANALQVTVPFGPVTVTHFHGEIALRLSTRIGTPANACPGHASATGLRVYYDATTRDSRFGTTVVQTPP